MVLKISIAIAIFIMVTLLFTISLNVWHIYLLIVLRYCWAWLHSFLFINKLFRSLILNSEILRLYYRNWSVSFLKLLKLLPRVLIDIFLNLKSYVFILFLLINRIIVCKLKVLNLYIDFIGWCNLQRFLLLINIHSFFVWTPLIVHTLSVCKIPCRFRSDL